MSYRQRRFRSPPVFLTYESITHNSRYSRSPSPSTDSEDAISDSESLNSSTGHQRVVGDMDMDMDTTLTNADGDHDSSGLNTHSDDHHNILRRVKNEDDADEEEEDEETRKANRRRQAEKRKGKRPEQSPQQKADARAARRRARAEAEDEAYRDAYRPILTIKSSQGFVWNQDLFIPAWQKDRYLCSTSPSSAADRTGMSPASTYLSSSMGTGMDYEVECVDIRIREGELEHIVPGSL